MPEQHKLRRRNIIVSIFKSVRGSGSAVVQRQHFSGNERAVVAIGDRVNAKRTENCGEGFHTRLLPSGNSISGRTGYLHPWVSAQVFSLSYSAPPQPFEFIDTSRVGN